MKNSIRICAILWGLIGVCMGYGNSKSNKQSQRMDTQCPVQACNFKTGAGKTKYAMQSHFSRKHRDLARKYQIVFYNRKCYLLSLFQEEKNKQQTQNKGKNRAKVARQHKLSDLLLNPEFPHKYDKTWWLIYLGYGFPEILGEDPYDLSNNQQ